MRWYAKLSNGDIEAMTLDELDAAYEKGVINGHTLVLAPEATDWAELEKLARLDDAETRATDGSTAPTDPSPRRRGRAPKWVAPIAVGTVAAAAFAAAGFEAQRAGAFSPRRAPPQEAPPSPPAIVATTDAPPPAAADLPRLPVPKEKERHSGRNPQRLAGTSEPSSGHAEAFVSGGNRYDPLNSDLP